MTRITSREARIEAGVTWAVGLAGLAMGMARYRPWMDSVERAVDDIKERYQKSQHDMGSVAVSQQIETMHLVEPLTTGENVVEVDFTQKRIIPPKAA